MSFCSWLVAKYFETWNWAKHPIHNDAVRYSYVAGLSSFNYWWRQTSTLTRHTKRSCLEVIVGKYCQTLRKKNLHNKHGHRRRNLPEFPRQPLSRAKENKVRTEQSLSTWRRRCERPVMTLACVPVSWSLHRVTLSASSPQDEISFLCGREDVSVTDSHVFIVPHSLRLDHESFLAPAPNTNYTIRASVVFPTHWNMIT